ncbi:avidin-like [Lissotriton helveticus]
MMALLITVSFLLFFQLILCTPEGKRCNMTGSWKNSLGSLLQLSEDGQSLKGCFYTAVETHKGAAGKTKMGKVTGIRNPGEDPTVAFSACWSGGAVTTWAGQCFCKSDPPVLKTMWLLRSPMSAEDHWKATRVGEDVFHPVTKSWICDSDVDEHQ